jgi:hypothetical protein
MMRMTSSIIGSCPGFARQVAATTYAMRFLVVWSLM